MVKVNTILTLMPRFVIQVENKLLLIATFSEFIQVRTLLLAAYSRLFYALPSIYG